MNDKEIKIITVSNGDVIFSKKQRLYLWTTQLVFHEDWKSHNREPIPANTKILVFDLMSNFYGKWIETYYQGRYYSIDPRYLEWRKE